jgi:hypothetical protein
MNDPYKENYKPLKKKEDKKTAHAHGLAEST